LREKPINRFLPDFFCADFVDCGAHCAIS